MAGISDLATAAVSLVAPFAPYLISAGKAGGKALAAAIGKKGGEAAWNKAKALWDRIAAHFSEAPALHGAALAVAAEPEDATYQATLVKALGDLLQRHPEVADELLKLIGGKDSVQSVLVTGKSRAENIAQDLEGAGTQTVDLREGSTGKNIRQRKR